MNFSETMYDHSGNFTGYQFTAQVNVVRFWVNVGVQSWEGISCSEDDWAAVGMLIDIAE